MAELTYTKELVVEKLHGDMAKLDALIRERLAKMAEAPKDMGQQLAWHGEELVRYATMLSMLAEATRELECAEVATWGEVFTEIDRVWKKNLLTNITAGCSDRWFDAVEGTQNKVMAEQIRSLSNLGFALQVAREIAVKGEF